VNREIVIGNQYTSIIGTKDDIYQLDKNYVHGETKEVPFKPICRNRTIRTKDFYNGLKTNFNNNNEILPVGCKYFETFGNGRKIIVIEEPPRIRTIKADIGMEATIEKLRITGKLKEYGYENYLDENSGRPYSFQLSFPYVVFIIVLNKQNQMLQMQPFFRLHPITSLSDYLFKAPLYNIPDSQTICLGSIINYSTVLETTENIIETFWLNRYNKDYTDNIKAYENSNAYEVQDYLSWMYFSKLDPMFIYNVSWLKFHRNIGRVISSVREYSNDSKNSGSSYELLQNIVRGTTSSTVTKKSNVRNTSYSLAIKGMTIQVGDEISFNNEILYLYSITTDDHEESYLEVELENSKGELISVPYQDFEKGLGDLYTKTELEEVEVNGKVIKPDDIITFKSGGCIVNKRIKSIRVAQDGKIEALIGNDHYLIENIDFSIMNFSNIKINGESLDKEKDYYIITSNEGYNNCYKIRKMKYKNISISGSGHIIIKFLPPVGKNGNSINLNHSDYENGHNDYDFIDTNNLIEPDTICHFDKLLVNSNGSESKPKFHIMRNKGILIDSNQAVRYYCGIDDIKEYLKKILLANRTRLYIPRIQCDIDFKVGDPIVYANWSNPEDMLLVSSIDSFEYDEKDNKLYINSTSLNKKVQFRIPYINFGNDNVNIGCVRKVESQCGDWKSGDKIKATTTGIINFPKKDTNSIIAFINDGSTKYPLAICSNLCTLWMNQDTISKFKRIPFKSDDWKKSEIVEFDLEKIKWQHGDHFTDGRSNSIKFLARKNGTRYSFEYHYVTSWANLEWGTSITKNDLKYVVRHGITMPRISVANPRMAENKTGFPNMLGGYILNTNAKVSLRSEQFKEDF
jgi:hypothetical protein